MHSPSLQNMQLINYEFHSRHWPDYSHIRAHARTIRNGISRVGTHLRLDGRCCASYWRRGGSIWLIAISSTMACTSPPTSSFRMIPLTFTSSVARSSTRTISFTFTSSLGGILVLIGNDFKVFFMLLTHIFAPLDTTALSLHLNALLISIFFWFFMDCREAFELCNSFCAFRSAW